MRATDPVAVRARRYLTTTTLALALCACGSPADTPAATPPPAPVPVPTPSVVPVAPPPTSAPPAVADPLANLLDDDVPAPPAPGLGIGISRLGHRSAARVPRIRLGTIGLAPARPLSPEVVARAVLRHINEIRFCYEVTLNDEPELAGDIELTWTIEPSGATSDAAIASTSLHTATAAHGGPPARAVETCARAAVLRWTFPATERETSVRVTCPVTLESSPGS